MTNRKEVFRKLGIIVSIFALVCTLLLTACGSTGAQPDGQISADDEPSEEVGEAFAVYSADDNTLTFYSDVEAPEAGSDFEGKVATEVYEGIEAADYLPGWSEDGRSANVKRVSFVGHVAPESCADWFCAMYDCEEIVGLERLDTSKVTDFSGMFDSCFGLKSLDVSGLDTSSGTDFSRMFSWCSGLTSLDVSGLDTSSGTDFSGMFDSCFGLKSLDVSGFDTSNGTDFSGMFIDCFGLTSLDVSGFDTSNGTDFSNMFYSCSGLTSLDVSGFDTSNGTDFSEMFVDCFGLTSLDVSGFDTSNGTDFSNMFSGDECLSVDCSAWDVSKAERIDRFKQDAPGVIPPNWGAGISDAPSSGGFDQPKKDKPSTTPSAKKDELITDTDGKQVWKVWAAAPTLHLEGSFEGQGNFIVKVLDDNQDLEELVCNEIGDHVLDKKVSVEVGRMYYIQIECSRGSWSMIWTGTGGA